MYSCVVCIADIGLILSQIVSSTHVSHSEQPYRMHCACKMLVLSCYHSLPVMKTFISTDHRASQRSPFETSWHPAAGLSDRNLLTPKLGPPLDGLVPLYIYPFAYQIRVKYAVLRAHRRR